MPYVEDRDGIDLPGKNPWKGSPVAIVERIREIIGDLLGHRLTADLQPTTRFVADLGIDSLADVELVIATEEAFSIAIPDEDATQLITVGDLVRYVTEATSSHA